MRNPFLLSVTYLSNFEIGRGSRKSLSDLRLLPPLVTVTTHTHYGNVSSCTRHRTEAGLVIVEEGANLLKMTDAAPKRVVIPDATAESVE